MVAALTYLVYDQPYLCLKAIQQVIANGVYDPQTAKTVGLASTLIVDKEKSIFWENFSSYFQIYYGSDIEDFNQKGGNFHQKFTASVAIYSCVLLDTPQAPTLATEAISNMAIQVRNLLHQRPLTYTAESATAYIVTNVPVVKTKTSRPKPIIGTGQNTVFVMGVRADFAISSCESYLAGTFPANLQFADAPVEG